MNWEDPIVADVRRIREDLSAKFNFELSAIFADIRARQSEAGDRLVRWKRDGKAAQASESESPTGAKSNS